MLALGFLHPALLWALLLAAVPIVIHLLNRRRFETVPWAAMEYLLAAMKRNRRRLRMEQWIVLLLRVLAVVLLALLVARPQMTVGVLGDVRTHHVILLDDSASMSQRRGATDAFQVAIARVTALTSGLAETRSHDLLSILRASKPERPILLGANIGSRTKADVRRLMAELRVGDDVADLAALLSQARHRIDNAAEASRAEIYLITDFRAIDWLTDGGKPRPALLKELMALEPEHERLTVVSVAPADSENLAVVGVRRAGRTAAVGVPLQLLVEVKNQGSSATAPTEVALSVDEKGRVLRVVGALEPGEVRELSFAHTFRASGFHGAVASLPRDHYEADDLRALAIDVAESSHVLLVDGDPGDRPEEAETYFLAAALEHRESGIAVDVIPEHILGGHDLTDVDMIFLCNAPAPDERTVEKLEEFVGDGGGLVVFLGNQVDPQRYNQVFFKGGKGLLPVELADLAGDLDRPEHVYVADKSHSTMRVATEDLELMFAKLVWVGRYMRVLEHPAVPVKVPLRIGDATGDPLLLSHTYGGGGEVMLVTATADAHWTNWPRWPTFLIVAQEMHRRAAKAHDDSAANMGPGDVLHLPLDTGHFRPDVVVRELGKRSVDYTFTARALRDHGGASSEPEVEIPMRELMGFGLFEVELTPHAGQKERRLLSRNGPVAEGRLTVLTQRDLFGAYPDELQGHVSVVESGMGGAAMQGGFGETWRTLAMALMAVLLLESFLAWRFGRR